MINRRRLLASGIGAALLSHIPTTWATGHDNSADVIVVGGGGAGIAAAISAAETGASVLLFEKLPFLGGDTLRSTGHLSVVNHPLQKKYGIEDSLELHYRQTMQFGRDLANPAIVRNMIEGGPDTVAWLQACGVAFEDKVYEIYGSLHQRCMKPILSRGTGYIQAMTQKALSLGVRIKTDAWLTRLVRERDGRVTDAEFEFEDGQRHLVHAKKGLILATGGFGANPEMLSRYAPEYSGLPTDNSSGSTGEALHVAATIGADLVGMNFIECVAGNVAGNSTPARLFMPSEFILVNAKGERFVEEDVSRLELTSAILKQPDRRCFTVFDSIGEGHLDMMSRKNLYQALVANEVVQCDDLEMLAKSVQMPVDSFLQTIQRYNSQIKSASFGPATKCTRLRCTPLRAKPFWLYEVGLIIHYTLGGVLIDENTQVIDRSERPIPGLWAAGEVTGCVHGANRLGGNGLLDAFYHGRKAGRMAAAG